MRVHELNLMNMEVDKNGKLLPPTTKINARPGLRMGMTPEEVREFIRRQKTCLGKSFTLTTGSNDGLSIQLPGTAYMLLGWAIHPSPDAASNFKGDLSVRLNNEVMVDSVWWEFYGKEFTDEEFYFIPRPLSGHDTFTFAFDNVDITWDANIVFYYLS